MAYRMVSSMLTPGLGVTEKTGVEGHGKCRLKIVKSKVLWTENRKVGTNYEVWLPMLIPRSMVACRIRSPKLRNWIGACHNSPINGQQIRNLACRAAAAARLAVLY